MTRTSILKRTIASRGYYSRRMTHENAEASYYLDLAERAANAPLKRAYMAAALMYFKRSEYYINKLTNHEHRKSL